MPNYQNAKIYKLWSPEGDDIYIGSTTQKLCDRKAGHNGDFKNNKKCSSAILYNKYNDIRIELLECCPCDNKEELKKKEGEYIRNNECVNRCIAGRTKKEYNEDNKEKIKEQTKEYREKNKEIINEKIKEYREKNKEIIKCDCGGSYQLYRKKRHERTQKHQDMVNTFGNLK
jgi:hypothetical protein